MALSRRHYRLASPPPDTPEQIAERIRARAAMNQADAEMKERFGILTFENAQAAMDWREARFRELIAHPVGSPESAQRFQFTARRARA